MTNRPDLNIRNRRIVRMFQQGVIRKQIANRLGMEYDTVLKVIKKFRNAPLAIVGKSIILDSFPL